MSATLPVPNPRRYLPLILAISGVGTVLSASLVVPALPDLAAELEVSRAMIGWVQGAVAIPGILLALFVGYLADRVGRRKVAFSSLVVFGLAGLACYASRSFWLLVAMRAVQGIGTAGLLSLGVILIGDIFPPGTERRWAFGVNNAGLTAIGIVSPIVGGLLAEIDPFLPFTVYGLALPLAALTLLLPERARDRPVASPIRHLRRGIESLRSQRRLPAYLGTLAMGVFIVLVLTGLGFTVTPLFLVGGFGVSAAARGLIQAFVQIGSATTSLGGARFTHRYGRPAAFSAGLALVAAGLATVGVAPALPVVAVGLLVFGLGLGFIFPFLDDMAVSSVPGAFRGSAVGAFIVSNRLGASLGPVLFGGFAAAAGDRWAFLTGAGLAAMILFGWRPLRSVANRRRP